MIMSEVTTTPDAVEWRDGMNFQAIDSDGEVFQYKYMPFHGLVCWYVAGPHANEPDVDVLVGKVDPPADFRTTLIRRYPAMPGDPILVSDDGKQWWPGILHELRPDGDWPAQCKALDSDGNVAYLEPWKFWKPWPGVTPGY